MATFSADASASAAVQGDVVGIIVPPPEIRQMADATAKMVAQRGEELERRIASTPEMAAKCTFIRPDDPFNAYYKAQVAFHQNGGSAKPAGSAAKGPKAAKAADADSAKSKRAAKTVERAAVRDPLADARRVVPDFSAPGAKDDRGNLTGAAKPPPLPFLIDHPTYLDSATLSLVRLTAQHAAVAGGAFLDALLQREHGNPRFGFLRPSHPMCEYFRALVDRYAATLRPQPGVLASLRAAAGGDRDSVLRRCVHRLEAARWARRRRGGQGQGAGPAINWHDFVVVESIDFPQDEATDALPEAAMLSASAAPTKRVGAEAADEAQRRSNEAIRAAAQAQAQAQAAAGGGGDSDMDDGSDMDDDMDDDDDLEGSGGGGGGGAAADGGPSSSSSSSSASASSDAAAAVHSEPGLVVKDDYKPQIRSAGDLATGSHAVEHFVDPRTGRALRIADASEHLRIGLIDKQYAEDQARAAAKHKESALVGDEDVAANLRRMAQRRADVFGAAASDEAAQAVAGAAQADKRHAPDGGAAGGPAKRAKLEVAEAPVPVRAPVDPENPEWGLDGQLLAATVFAGAPAIACKAQLQPLLGGMPPSRMQLWVESASGAQFGELGDDDIASDRIAAAGPGALLRLEVRPLF
ncbi:hypothetical protein FNF28_06776 [Cafeteria roenbergensis]|uniref:SURP motif domain-containing protein n=1 Tax=Cafeteria roenbergensis TaxID=33653 RepID=A0A5A8CPQ8_CAFRO|nr:hypothetical protein FNF28_06776 [Cafeteria roenbergensis]